MPQSASDPNDGSRIGYDPINGTATLSWWGQAGMYYYILWSEDLVTWNYYPSLVLGTGAIASFNTPTNATRFFLKLEAHPTSTDSDGDGLTDVDEVTRYHTDPHNPDTDGDGLTDGYEVRVSRTNPNSSDSDGDGLSDAEEAALGTNPNLKDTDGDGVWDGVDQYPLDIRRVQDIPVIHYIAIDISTPIIGDNSVWDIALDDSNQVAFGYNDSEPPDITHVVGWKDGAQAGSTIDYSLSYHLGEEGTAYIWADSVNTAGAITGAGSNPKHPEDGYPQGYVMSPGDSYPSFHSLFRQYPYFDDISSGYGRIKNSGVTFGSETWAFRDCSDCAALSIPFIDESPTYPFFAELLNDSGAAVGFNYDASGQPHLSILSGAGLEDVFQSNGYDSSQALAIGAVPEGYCVIGLSPYLGNVTTLEEILVPPSETNHPFLKVEGQDPIDFYSVLGIFKNQLAFPSDYNAGAGMNNQGDILLKARTIDGPTNTAPYSREVLLFWNRATQSLHEIDLPDKIKLGDPYRTIGDLQLNKDHLIVAVQEFDDDGFSYLQNPRAILGMPFELGSDLNNDGKVGEGSDSSLKTAGAEDTASVEAKEKATEYMFVNDQLSNGAWDKEQSDPNKPASETNDDDAEELKTIGAATWGAVWFEYEGGDITKLAFYKTKECTAAGKVTFPFALSETNKLPEKLYVRAEPENAWTAQVEGKLVMKFGKADKSETWATDKLRFTVVKEVGNTKYFHAARDYMLEQNTRLHVRYFKSGSHNIRITAMRHESTDMKVIETYQPNPKIYGMPDVVAKSQDYYDLILNGNFCFFDGGLAGRIRGIGHGEMTSRCHGGCVVAGANSPASSEGGTSPFEQANAEYLSAKGKGTFAITTGVVPLSPPVHQAALGGFASNLVGEPYNIHPWFGFAEIGPTSDKKKLIFTVTQTAATTQYPVADLVARLTASGQTLCVAGDGGSSTACAQRIEGDSTRVKFAGTKHYPSNDFGHYWINTYVGFKSDKPR